MNGMELSPLCESNKIHSQDIWLVLWSLVRPPSGHGINTSLGNCSQEIELHSKTS